MTATEMSRRAFVVIAMFAALTVAVQPAKNQDLLRRLSANHIDANAIHGLSNAAGAIKYDAPDDCRYRVHPNQDVTLACMLRTVNSDVDTTNFNVIPADHTVSLSIICNTTMLTKSNLEVGSFAHLARLGELSLDYCKLGRLHPGALFGLTELRNLSIRTHNMDWPSLNLDIEPESFQHTRNLERLDLTHNNIWSLPEQLFCSLTSLRGLNISINRLQDVNDLGFSEKMPANGTETNRTTTQQPTAEPKSCVLDMEVLDASHNHFVTLPGNGFGSLKRLRHLTLHHNEISMVDDRALRGLKHLQVLNLSSNKIVALPSALFTDPASTIQEIYLQNNTISVLSPKLFANLEQLHALDLSQNAITSTWIDRHTFSGLIRLVSLDLSYNRITKLEPEFFSDLYTLQILNMRHNNLELIAADTFAPMNNLHTLILSHNNLKYLDAYSLNGLYVLSLLALDNNKLSGVHPDAFRNCSSLQDLNMNDNHLKTVPQALKDMRLLRTVDLGENLIEEFSENCFHGMTNLYGLRMLGNRLQNVSKTVFKDLPSLQIINLAQNRISYVEPGTFEAPPSLQAIRMDGNQLTGMHGMFAHAPNLVWLNMSANLLTELDYAELPRILIWLDVHGNAIGDLTDQFGVKNRLLLQTFDLSFNRLTRIGPHMLPNNVELLFLNNNWISDIDAQTFMEKGNLTRVDLYANLLQSLDESAVGMLPFPEHRPLPQFYIGGNPFVCDCKIDWLQKVNQKTSRQHPLIMDLDAVYCKLRHHLDRSFISLIDADPMHFLCTYTDHCFALCHCCEFEACDCHMTCPDNCTCFHDQLWRTNIVECSASGYNDVPSNIPMDTSELYLSGNNLETLSGAHLMGRRQLLSLFANNSNIQTLSNDTFHGMTGLLTLHLENNRIGRLDGDEFASLESLRQLHLQNNRLTFIDNRTFATLHSLEVLRLENNKLMHFEVWQLSLNPYLLEVGLADNMWSCECSFVRRLREFTAANGEKIIDAGRISCVSNDLSNAVMRELNGTKCELRHGDISTVAHTSADDMNHMLPFLLAVSCACAGLVAVLLGLFCYRHELRAWWQASTCPAALCYKSAAFHHPDDYDKDRLYDAYVSYSMQDEHFVNQILANTLENNIGYRICLHYRDFNVNTYVADTIVEAVDSSRRTLIVLSRNFLYNEWSRFEVKSALHECVKRRRKLVFILYGDLPQRDIDNDMRMYLRASTCIEWDDKKFWQKLRMAMPSMRIGRPTAGDRSMIGSGPMGPGIQTVASGTLNAGHHSLGKRSAVNIYATSAGQYHASGVGLMASMGRAGVHPMGGLPPMPGHVVDYATGRRIANSGGGGLLMTGTAGIPPPPLPPLVGLDCNNYATINDCGRICDKYEAVLCKYSTSNDRQRGQQQLLKQQQQHSAGGRSHAKTLDRQFPQHEYAVPSNLLDDDEDDTDDMPMNDERIGAGGGHPAAMGGASAYERYDGRPPTMQMMMRGNAASSASSSQSAGSEPSSSANVFSFNSSQLCNNCDNALCAGDDQCPSLAGLSLNSTLAANDALHGPPSVAGRHHPAAASQQQQQQQQQTVWA